MEINRMDNEIQIIKSFIVQFTDGKKLKKRIEHFYLVEEYIYLHGTYTIKKIIFDFIILNRKTTYFPYGIHNIVIENLFDNNKFKVNFYHYYNCLNERIEFSKEQYQKDYYIMMKLLESTYCIYYYLGQHIIYPFYIDTQKIQEI
jgi:hypothetical protein